MKRRTRKQGSKAAGPAKTPVDSEKPTGAFVSAAGADRRTHPRYQFTAAIEIVGATSGVRIYCQLSKGMGLVFTAIESQQLPTLEAWLTESRETSWLAANRRRSQRVLMKIPVRVSGQNALGGQCSRSVDSRLDACKERAAARSVERPDKSCTGVYCRPHSTGRPASGGSGVHAAQSDILARGLSAERLDTSPPRCKISGQRIRVTQIQKNIGDFCD
jgi:hypothetical protein